MTAVSDVLVQRYRDSAIALLPPGRAIAKRIGSNVSKLLEGVAVEFARIHEDSEAAVLGSVPDTATGEYLTAWEDALGLPGKCVHVPSTVESERQGAAVAKLRGRTSHSKPAYEAAAEALGYEGLEFKHFPPFTIGSSVGDALYGDEWANVVQVVVPVGTQTAEGELVCALTDELRRSHGFISILLEGPMGSTRRNVTYFNTANNLGAHITPTASFVVDYSGHVSIQCTVDNGAGAAPTDSPQGTWALYATSDGVNFTPVVDVSGSTAIADQLAKIKPNGNNLVSGYAVFDNFPGTAGKLHYVRTSGGGTSARARVNVTTW